MVDLKSLCKKALSDCPPDKAFWFCNGVIARNIYELVNNISSLSNTNFKYHVNFDHDKNDFAKWICEVLDDDELASLLKKSYDKDVYADIIQQRIWALEDACNS